ncbi:amylo-alpha-1,6-glucosidase [Cohnella luojiensis]|uniref:Amylo-alpha-1,6-glucosidase n=1 Tax=Cohnella luojiensis TaxID=652876 RepID=A0A4Y8LZI3_9BACL|nr:amylo-alpha-1,6-glucosidase [Cohnella luojiensis]TFE27160.1 amylo-alpha-1,6-glucosidase [Cohnella luojiensis]
MNYTVIKEGGLFFLTDTNGDIAGDDQKGHGLYKNDTRYLSRMELFINGDKPTLLSSEANRSYYASIRLMKVSPDEGAIEMVRERYIYDGMLHEKVSLTNYFLNRTRFDFSVSFDADFQDMFIVRKYRTGEVGQVLGRKTSERGLSIQYKGKDDIVRETHIAWDAPESKADTEGNVHFTLDLETQETKHICFVIAPVQQEEPRPIMRTYEEGLRLLEASYDEFYRAAASVTTNVDVFDKLYQRGVQDLRMLMTDVGYGDMPVAGLPWFAVPFGRDSLITALFMLPLNPNSAKGTLRTLAAYQGTTNNVERDEQPGKIMHEIRFGELVNTKQSPFGPYYGSVDATPLFLVLIVEYVRWTGDLSLAEELLPNVIKALAWIDTMDETGNGFLTYHQEAAKGFPNQGWKDSANSIVHRTGEYAESPIALSEVQGYVYQAKNGLSPIMMKLGYPEFAIKLEGEAAKLKEKFEHAFWMEDESYYAVALDRKRNQVQSVTSNPGHLLMTGLPDKARADALVKRLTAPDMFNGYGIRTMSTDSTGYYPMSYHNGSVWPHDNGMILLGLSRLGYKKEAGKLLSSLLHASTFFEYQRLPELFCGNDAELGYPVPYPTTCSPQAWAAGTSIVFVQAMLGLVPDALSQTIVLDPYLPETFNELLAEHIRIGAGYLSVKVTRTANAEAPAVEIIENTTGYRLI